MKIFLDPNLQKEKAASITKEAIFILQNVGITCILPDILQNVLTVPNVIYLPIEEANRQSDFVITIGGDGTLLHAALRFLESPKPLLGINVGRLGFLTSIEESDLSSLLLLVSGHYTIEKRRILRADIPNQNVTVYALNEFTIASNGILQALHFSVFCDDIKTNDYRGDGVIIATTTGSTAYSLSAGGPIVDVDLDAMIVTPICAHSLNTPPLVLSGNRKVSVYPAELGQESTVVLAIDGGKQISLTEEDVIKISLSEKSLPLVSLSGNQQLKAIDQKLKGR